MNVSLLQDKAMKNDKTRIGNIGFMSGSKIAFSRRI
jgi:hypothetical protein